MAYVGNTPADKTLKLEKQQFTTSATTSYTLSHSVSDPQDIALFINNVRQNPNSSYTVSGTTLTLSAATASTDTMYCVFLGRAIGTVGIAASSVTKDKVDFISDGTGSGVISKGDGSSIDGSIQLNCHVNSHGIKLKSPPHSAGQSYTLTFPSTAPVNGKVLQTDGSGNLSFANAGISMADQWRLNANKTSNAVFTSNLERVDTDGYGQLGTGMTESSGNFTFPSTGIYLIDMVVASDNQTTTGIYTTTDDSSYGKAAEIYSDSSIQSGNCKFIFDVTNTSTHKVQFQKTGGGGTVYGTTAHNQTHFTFIRLGDT